MKKYEKLFLTPIKIRDYLHNQSKFGIKKKSFWNG